MKKDEMKKDNRKNPSASEVERQRDQRAIDKGPGAERGKGDKVGTENLKGKKVDADPSQQSGRPEGS